MAGLIKVQAGSLVAALALCALPLGGRQAQRIPALGVVRLAGGSDGLSIQATSFDGTITTSPRPRPTVRWRCGWNGSRA
jgi:hypothetical protein